jgi:hypothetical protein
MIALVVIMCQVLLVEWTVLSASIRISIRITAPMSLYRIE